MPLYLLDRKVSSKTIGLWTGIIGQSFSILGTIVSGLILKKTNKTVSTYKWLIISASVRILPIVLINVLVFFGESESSLSDFQLYSMIFNVQLQLFLSGFLTTITFTFMMEVSFLAPKQIQASHFSLLATSEVFGKLILQPFVSMFTDRVGYLNAFYLFTSLYFIYMIPFFIRTPVKTLKKT